MNKEWRECQLGDVITLQRGFDLPERDRVPGDVPIVSSSGTTGFHNTAKTEAPGVVTGRYGTLGEVHFVTKDFWPLNTTLFVKDFKGNDPRFIAYFLRTLNFSSQNVAGAVPGVNRNYLHLLEVKIPPVTTQRKIAGILSAYDDLIENNTRRITILEEMAQAIYREWFVHFRFPGHENAKFVDSPLGRIPEGWEAGSLENCLVLQRGFDITKAQQVPGPYPVVSSSGPTSTHSEFMVKGPGVVIGRKGSLGTVFYVETDHWPHDTTLWIKEYRRSTPLHAYFLLRSLGLAQYDSGASNPTLNRNHIHTLPVVVPPSEILGEFDVFVEPIFKQKRLLTKKCSCLRETRNLLLPRLISGQRDVEQLDIDMGELLPESVVSPATVSTISVAKPVIPPTTIKATPYKDDAAILCLLLDELGKLTTDRPNDEFVVQKHLFGLKHLRRLPVNSRFVSQKAGPWSQELRRKVFHAGIGFHWLYFDETSKQLTRGRRFAEGVAHAGRLLGDDSRVVAELVQDLAKFGKAGLGRWMTIFKVVCDLQEARTPVTRANIQTGVDHWPGKRDKPDFSVAKVDETITKMVRRNWFVLD